MIWNGMDWEGQTIGVVRKRQIFLALVESASCLPQNTSRMH